MTSKGWLIYSKQDAKENMSFIEWFLQEAKNKEIELTLILREKLQIGIIHNEPCAYINHKKTTLPDFAIVRTVEPLLSFHIEQLGVKVFNSSHISSICNHKARTHLEINKLQIPMVSTLFVKSQDLPTELPFPLPFVIKEAGGRGGKQVYFIQTKTEWMHFLKSSINKDLIIQTADVQLGKDVRVFVVGKEIIGAVLRESNSDFRANFKLGGSATWYELSSKEKQLIERIIQHFDFGMVGIDFLFDDQGNLLFNEIEDVVGSRTLSSVSSINIVEKYITFIKQQLAKKEHR